MRNVYEMSTDDMVKLVADALEGAVDVSGAKVGGGAGTTEIQNIVVKESGKVISFPFDYSWNEDDFKMNVKNHFLLNK